MPTVMITGANRGLGLEFARQYADDGWRVIATCRDPKQARDLGGIGGAVEVHALDIADSAAVEALANKTLKKESIDVLINNAGIYGPRPSPLGGIDYEAWSEVFRINTMAPLKVCEAFLEQVARSDQKKIAILSSKMGSIADNGSGGSYIYRSSKAALNIVAKSLAVDLQPRGMVVLPLHPGWVRTDMGGPSALIDTPESVAGMRDVIARSGPEDSGKFFNYDGAEIPW